MIHNAGSFRQARHGRLEEDLRTILLGDDLTRSNHLPPNTSRGESERHGGMPAAAAHVVAEREEAVTPAHVYIQGIAGNVQVREQPEGFGRLATELEGYASGLPEIVVEDHVARSARFFQDLAHHTPTGEPGRLRGRIGVRNPDEPLSGPLERDSAVEPLKHVGPGSQGRQEIHAYPLISRNCVAGQRQIR